jgi:ABC-2 type transport system permease protein
MEGIEIQSRTEDASAATETMSVQTSAVPSPLALLLRANLTQMVRRLKGLRDQSRLLTALIVAFIIGYFGLAFALFHHGLWFIAKFPGFGALLVERLMFLLFAFLFAMLLLSNLVIGYTNLFRNRETGFLWTLPVPAQTIYRWKFIETALLASWAFLFLISPLLLAYGLTQRVAWHFYLITPVMVALFIILPAVIGMWLAMNLARFIDRRSFQVILVTVLSAGLAVAAWWLKPQLPSDDLTDTRMLAVIDKLLERTRFAQFPLLPSYWLTSAVVQWADGALGAAGFFLSVLLSNVLLFGFLSFTGLGNLLYDAASMVQSRGSVFGHWEWFRNRRDRRTAFHYAAGPAEKFFRLFRWLGPDERAVLIKDARMFWRDTTQWGQTLMLFGLLGVYILNLRHFTQQVALPFWVHLISYLNLGACSLNLATLTTRFVYPQFSLEGRRLWIVGMSPLGMERVLKLKFWLATGVSLVVTTGLMWLSCHLIATPWHRTLFFLAAGAVMTFTLNGLAVGLGALYPNFREENPSKIVSGFGGTLCLVLSFVYILAAVVLLAFGSPWVRIGFRDEVLRVASWVGFAGLSLGLGLLPFRAGMRRVGKLEI